MSEKDKQMTEVLQKDFSNIKSTMDSSSSMMCFTKNDVVIYVNMSWLNFTGETLFDMLGDGRFKYVHKEDVTQTKEVINSFLKAQKPYRVQYRLQYRDTTYKWVVEDGRPFFSSEGTQLGFISKCVDIDKEKKLEIKLHLAETKYRRLFETAHDGILILDAEITDVNPFLQELLGYSQEEFIGKKLWEVGPFKNIPKSKEFFKILQDTGYVRYEDMPLETKSGELVAVEFVSNAYMAGGTRVMQCNIRDIRERKRAEMVDTALTTLKQEKQRNAFIADVTHELRTPLAIIKGNVELALLEKNVKNKKTFEAINQEVNHLSKMIVDLTVLTRDSQGAQRKINSEKIDLSTLLTDVVTRLHTVSALKKIDITLEMPPEIMISGDVSYLEKLFSNVISNAIYYGKENGYISVCGTLQKKHVVITFTDNGIGISKEDLPNIFERFYRAPYAREVNHNGNGLGLAMSKWIVEAHLGTITVVSELDKGTTFTITLPLFS